MKMAYLTLDRGIPSQKADGICVMNNCSSFSQQGVEVELILPGRFRRRPETFLKGQDVWNFYGVPKNFTLIYKHFPFYGLSRIFRMIYALFAVIYAIRRGNDVIYSRQIELAYFAALFGKVSIFESHNYHRVRKHPFFPLWTRLVKSPTHQAAMIVTTQAAAQACRKRGIPGEKLFVASNGADIKKFSCSDPMSHLRSSLGLPQDKVVAGFCGSLYRGRGIEELLDCAGSFKEVLFLIVGGEVEDIERCKKYADELGLSNVEFAGFVNQAKVPSYIMASDILIQPYTRQTPSYRYMSPMKMFDYLASGRPIVATDFPVIREILCDKQNSVLVPPGSGRAIASGITWLLNHPVEAEKIGKQARADAEYYSWEKRSNRIFSWLRQEVEAVTV